MTVLNLGYCAASELMESVLHSNYPAVSSAGHVKTSDFILE